MSIQIIRAAFEQRLGIWARDRVPSIQVAWQNASFSPPKALYLRAFILPAETMSQDMAGGHRAYHGVFQVSVVAPAGSGPLQADAVATEIADLFPVNLRINDVMVLSPMSIAAPLQDTTTYTVPVSCRYRLDTI